MSKTNCLSRLAHRTLVSKHGLVCSRSLRRFTISRTTASDLDTGHGSVQKIPELASIQSWPGLQPVVQFEPAPTSGQAADGGLNAKSFSLFRQSLGAGGQEQVQTKSRFDAVVLRDMCKCAKCRDPDSGQKRFATHEIPLDISIKHFSVGENGVRLEWENDLPGIVNHHSEISLEDLQRHSFDFSSSLDYSEINRPMVGWRSKDMEKIFADGGNKATYESLLQDPQTLERVLYHLWTSGLVFVTDVPHDEESVVRVANSVGPLRDSFYGRTWDVKDKPNAVNVAYTSQYLGLHMDLLYMKNPPDLQLLHCLESANVGGRSIFSDAYQAAQDIYRDKPHYFDILSTFPVSYNYNKGGNWYRDHKVVFQIDQLRLQHAQNSSTNKFTTGAMPPLSSINWSPPFQGDFEIDYGSRDEARGFRLWVEAAKAFDERLNAKENLFAHSLAPGECVLFHNRRVVHGREAFESGKGARWLKGCYVDLDPFESRMRTAARNYVAPSEAPSAAQVFPFAHTVK